MFFTKHTTPFEQKKGSIPYDVLMGRYLVAKDDFLGDSEHGLGEIEASVFVGDTVYELAIDISRSGDEEADAISWMEMAVDAESREMGGGYGNYPDQSVPLTWPAVVTALCKKFQLNPELVWNTGIDVRAYWNDQGDDEYLKVPREADRARYTLARLYRQP